MKMYVLFEKSTFSDGDKLIGLSKTKDKVKSLLKEKRDKVLLSGLFRIEEESDESFIAYDNDGDMYELSIEVHETLK